MAPFDMGKAIHLGNGVYKALLKGDDVKFDIGRL